jgi:hypothetical protein
VGIGYCKRIYTFNPGGVGTNYLRRIFHKRKYSDNETPSDFLFIQGYGWDNYEWFRGLGIVSEWDFYHSPEWNEPENVPIEQRRRFIVFTTQTDFGRKLNALRPAQRIGELMGSFENFGGQFFADVWEEKSLVLRQDLVTSLIKPWWRRWLATDWGLSHYAATYWLATGVLSIEEMANQFGVQVSHGIAVIIVYRELLCSDVSAIDMARVIVEMTPAGERRECRDHWMSPDAWARESTGNTVVDQMDPVLARAGMARMDRADNDRAGGWELLYNCFATARALARSTTYTEQPGSQPALFISSACPELILGIPNLIQKDDNPKDIQKMPGQMSDDCADSLRYGVKSYLNADAAKPPDITRQQTFDTYQDPTARAMAMLRLEAAETQHTRLQRRRRV